LFPRVAISGRPHKLEARGPLGERGPDFG
jgi:hypothetical protein